MEKCLFCSMKVNPQFRNSLERSKHGHSLKKPTFDPFLIERDFSFLQFGHDFMESARVQSYKVRFPRASLLCKGSEITMKEKYYINCDGEVLPVTRPEFEVRLHHRAVRLYGAPAGTQFPNMTEKHPLQADRCAVHQDEQKITAAWSETKNLKIMDAQELDDEVSDISQESEDCECD